MTKIIVFWWNEEKIFNLIHLLQDLEKYDEANRIANCNEYVLMFFKLSLLMMSLGDTIMYLVVSMFGSDEYKLVLPWIFEIDCDLMYYITYLIQIIQAIIMIPVYISIESLPFGLMLLLEAHIENIGQKVSKIGWKTDVADVVQDVNESVEMNVNMNHEYLNTVLLEDKTKNESLHTENMKVNEIHNKFYQEDGAMPSTSTKISSTSRDYFKKPWNSQGYWGTSPEVSGNYDDSEDEDEIDEYKEGCKNVMDLSIKRRIIFDEFIKPKMSFVRHRRVFQPSTFVMPTKPIKSQNKALNINPTTSMEDLLKHCIDYQAEIFKYT